MASSPAPRLLSEPTWARAAEVALAFTPGSDPTVIPHVACPVGREQGLDTHSSFPDGVVFRQKPQRGRAIAGKWNQAGSIPVHDSNPCRKAVTVAQSGTGMKAAQLAEQDRGPEISPGRRGQSLYDDGAENVRRLKGSELGNGTATCQRGKRPRFHTGHEN